MKHNIDVLERGVIYIDGKRVFGSKPYGWFSTITWRATDQDLKRIADRCLEVIADRKTENSSGKPNNCEHITEDGVTCAKYPACDDCLDNPLNKVKGSERLVKSSEQTEPTISKMEQVEQRSCDTCKGRDIEGWKNPCLGCTGFAFYEPKDEPQTCSFSDCDNFKNPDYERCIECKRKQIKLKTSRRQKGMSDVDNSVNKRLS